MPKIHPASRTRTILATPRSALLLVLLTSAGAFFGATVVRCEENRTPTEVESPGVKLFAVRNAAQSRRAIVLITVDWSVNSKLAEAGFCKFAEEYLLAGDGGPIGFHVIDFTYAEKYGPLESLEGFRELEGVTGKGMVVGNGEVVWLEHGRVLALDEFGGKEMLAKRTRELFKIERKTPD